MEFSAQDIQDNLNENLMMSKEEFLDLADSDQGQSQKLRTNRKRTTIGALPQGVSFSKDDNIEDSESYGSHTVSSHSSFDDDGDDDYLSVESDPSLTSQWERPILLNELRDNDGNMQDSDPFEDCSTYSEIIHKLEDHYKQRKQLAQYYFDGKKNKRKKCLFLCQTIFPIFLSFYFLVFLVRIESKNNKFHNKLIEMIYLDWGGNFTDVSTSFVSKSLAHAAFENKPQSYQNTDENNIHYAFNPIFNLTVSKKQRHDSNMYDCYYLN